LHKNRPFPDSQIPRKEYRTHFSSPESDSPKEINFDDVKEHLIAADRVDLEKLEQLEIKINLARLQLFDPMNANPQAVQPDAQAAAPQPIDLQQPLPQAPAPIIPPVAQNPAPPRGNVNNQPFLAQPPIL